MKDKDEDEDENEKRQKRGNQCQKIITCRHTKLLNLPYL